MKHKKYLPVMATVSAVILLAGCSGIKDTGDKESIMEKSRLLAAEDTTVESTQVMTEMETQEETTEEITIIEKEPEEVTEELTEVQSLILPLLQVLPGWTYRRFSFANLI